MRLIPYYDRGMQKWSMLFFFFARQAHSPQLFNVIFVMVDEDEMNQPTN